MGNAASLGGPALIHISGAHPVPLQDSSWTSLITQGGTLLAGSDPAAVEKEIRPHTASLVYNNNVTLNSQRLIYLVSQQLRKAQTHGGTIAIANVVHLAQAVLKDLVEQLNADQLHTFIELPAASLAGELGPALQSEFSELYQGSLVATLCRAGLAALACKPNMTAEDYVVQYETVSLLLVLCSSQLYIPHARAAPGCHPFLETLMLQQDLAAPAVEALLLMFVQSQVPPSGLKLYHPPDSRTVLHIVRSAAASVLWLPYTAYTLLLRRFGSQQDPAASPLADFAVLLLLALNFHPERADSGASNPFRQALQRVQDTDDVSTDAAAEGGHAAIVVGRAAVAYASLYDALGQSLVARETSVLLLYALYNGTPHFHEYCLARSDLDTLLLPLLELLYNARHCSANQLYMLLIILLMFSQEPSFAQNVHRITLPSVPFYKKRSLPNTTLGSLLVVLLLRTAHYNLATFKDVYTHTNTLAALANLGPHMSGLSAHAAQRLVSLFHLLARRYARLQQQQETAATVAGPPGNAGDAAAAGAAAVVEPEQDAERLALELQLYSDFIRIVLEIINSVLANALPSNPELVYALLHRQEVFVPFRSHPRYAELMDNVATVTEHFGRKVEEAMGDAPAGSVSADRVLALIKLHSRGWRKDKLRAVPELRFSYEEDASPEFFVPYLWSLAVASPSIPWTLSAIALFTPTVVRGSAGDEAAALSPRSPSVATPLPGAEEAPHAMSANV